MIPYNFEKNSEDYQSFQKISEEKYENFRLYFLSLYSPCERYLFHSVSSRVIRIYNAKRLWVFHEKPSKHLTVFSTETLNIKKLANLTANTKNYGQITLNTKPHSDPLIRSRQHSIANKMAIKEFPHKKM